MYIYMKNMRIAVRSERKWRAAEGTDNFMTETQCYQKEKTSLLVRTDRGHLDI